jgi:hypothetical protein
MKNKMRDYYDLDRHFVAPKVISPFYSKVKRLPRKVKKEMKRLITFKNKLTVEEKMWYRLSVINPDYHRFLIKKICEQHE